MKYASLGRNMKYSYSKIIHQELGYPYDLISLEPDEACEFLKKREFRGLSVTIPYKQTVMEYCDFLTPLAKEIGAVNALYFDENQNLWGTNTDYLGFLYAINTAGISLEGKKVLILGNGATCRTIKKAVTDNGAAKLIIASRKAMEDSESFIGDVPCRLVNCTHLQDHSDADIIINATPVGMAPDYHGSLIDLKDFPCCSGVFDVVYNPFYTRLIQQAEELQIPYASGLSMLVAQATAAAGFFHGKEGFYDKDTERIIAMLKEKFVQPAEAEDSASPQ